MGTWCLDLSVVLVIFLLFLPILPELFNTLYESLMVEGVDLGVLDPCIESFSGGVISRHVLVVVTEVHV